MNPFFDWLKDTGTQAVLLLVGTSAAIVAALSAIYYGRKSLTKKDLTQVEQNTEHLEEVRTTIASVDSRLKRQEDTEGLRIRASRISITASGNQAGNAPYPVHLSIKELGENKFLLTHVELYNEHGNSFGSFHCSNTGDPSRLDFYAKIPVTTMGDWFRSGTPVQTCNRMRLKLRVWMSIDGIEVSRDMAVIVVETMSGAADYILNG
jgi:hypothetical protein